MFISCLSKKAEMQPAVVMGDAGALLASGWLRKEREPGEACCGVYKCVMLIHPGRER